MLSICFKKIISLPQNSLEIINCKRLQVVLLFVDIFENPKQKNLKKLKDHPQKGFQ